MKKLNLTKAKFLYDHLLVKAITEGGVDGLVKPEQYEDKPEFGEVVAVGGGRLMEDGTVVPLKIKVGDTVFFGKYSTEKTRHLGEDYYIIREEDVKAVL